jgi:hypothetical protein
MQKTTVALLFTLFCVPLAAAAQSTISGRVLDQTGLALPGVAINLLVNSREQTATTDDVGRYRSTTFRPATPSSPFDLLNFSVLRRSVVVASSAATSAAAVGAYRTAVFRFDVDRRFRPTLQESGRRSAISGCSRMSQWRTAPQFFPNELFATTVDERPEFGV